jgi:hypothetical protein
MVRAAAEGGELSEQAIPEWTQVEHECVVGYYERTGDRKPGERFKHRVLRGDLELHGDRRAVSGALGGFGTGTAVTWKTVSPSH